MNIITPTILSKKIINKYFDLNKTIINISSGAANKSIPSWSTYCATKSALDRFTDTISKEKHTKFERLFSTSWYCKHQYAKKKLESLD